MLIMWTVHCIGRDGVRRDDRQLKCVTDELESVTRSALEMMIKSESYKDGRILKFRKYFNEREMSDEEFRKHGDFNWMFLPQYWEDENGESLSQNEVAALLTGNPTAVFVPPGFQQHDIDLWLTGRRPVSFDKQITDDDLKTLAYFVRDTQELKSSVIFKDGPGTLESIGATSLTSLHHPIFKSAASDDELRSFVTIFRRLYMQGERANVAKATTLLAKAFGDHPRARWIVTESAIYEARLNSTPDPRPLIRQEDCPFTVKELLDSFIYTQYAHQPDDKFKRAEQFAKLLNAFNGRIGALTWLFFVEVWKCGIDVVNIGNLAGWWLDQYRSRHSQQVLFVDSIIKMNPGIGSLEKSSDLKTRLFEEEVNRIANELWIQNGRPAVGPTTFRDEARQRLREAMGDFDEAR